MINRILRLDNVHNDSVFLWGTRQVGKITIHILEKNFDKELHLYHDKCPPCLELTDLAD